MKLIRFHTKKNVPKKDKRHVQLRQFAWTIRLELHQRRNRRLYELHRIVDL